MIDARCYHDQKVRRIPFNNKHVNRMSISGGQERGRRSERGMTGYISPGASSK